MAQFDTTAANENEYFANKLSEIKIERENGINPYPHKFNVTLSFENFISKYNDIEDGSRHPEHVENIAGRVMLIRDSSKKLKFYTLQQEGYNLQIMLDLRHYIFPDTFTDSEKLENFKTLSSKISRGDILGITGFVGKSHKGELSIFPSNVIILSRCLHLLPMSHFGIKDDELKQRKRYLSLIVNPDARKPFIIRHQIINYIREYLNNMQFMEVQTPILTPQAGGASAKPFLTYHNDHKMNMTLRVAPELYLKQLVVAGFERVFEIGQQFRNESIDRTHSPEFTSMEFYMAYADYNDLMTITEELFSNLAHKIHGTHKITCKLFDSEDVVDVDFTPPFRRIDFIKEIENQSGAKLPEDLSTTNANEFVDKLCTKFNIDCSFPRTTARLLDKLAGHFIEPQCTNPTFLINHPLIMSPLAKWHRNNSNLTERFELFIMGYEFANAYTELNDPIVQRQTFENQMKCKANGDEEAQPIDETFINALEFGLPPTGGFGLGIDRLAMLMSKSPKIQDVILFPTMKPSKN